jgi:trans-aconitate methyltransferase
MASKDNLDQIVAAMAEVRDPGWSSDYYLLRYRRRLILPRVRGPRVLELGCAEGGVTRELARQFPEVVAVDGSPALIEKARREIPAPNTRFVCSLLEDFDPGGRFNSIVAACVLEHIEHPVPVLRRSREWLAPGGTLHLTVPNAGALNRRVGRALGLMQRLEELHERDRRQGHFRVYSLPTLTADLEAAGLRVTFAGGNFLKPLSDAQMDQWDEKLLDAFFTVGLDFPELCAEIYVECQAA